MPRTRKSSWRSYRPGELPAPAPSGGVPGRSATVVPFVARPAEGVRILGLDPGSLRTGYGVIEVARNGDPTLVTQGCIDVSRDEFPARLRRIHQEVAALVERYRPAEIAVERVFVHRNVDSALKLGQARGAALAALSAEVAVFEYAPREIKLAAVGFGGAEKAQIGHMMRAILGIRAPLRPDAADALAAAICHAHARREQSLYGARIARAGRTGA